MFISSLCSSCKLWFSEFMQYSSRYAIIYVHIIRDRDFTRVKYGPDYMKKKEIRSTISER